MEQHAGSWVRYKWQSTILLVATVVLIAAVIMSGSVKPALDVAPYVAVIIAIGMCVGALLPVGDKVVLLVNVMLAGVATTVVAFGLDQLARGFLGLLVPLLLIAASYVVFHKVVVPRESRIWIG